jgi:hypothetical protein
MKTKIVVANKVRDVVLPDTPFIVKHADGKNFYMITKTEGGQKYLLTGFVNGISYDNNYTLEKVRMYIEDGTWTIVESTINVGV